MMNIDANTNGQTGAIPSVTSNTKPVRASPPLPPNWAENLESTLNSFEPYKLFPMAVDTLEYQTIAEMLKPHLKIVGFEQIVNPTLWSRFASTRKQMLQSKSDDLKLLSRLTMNEREIAQQMHVSLNFQKDAQVAACPYNDNVALLFHCTRSQKNAESILVQGLDERLGNYGNLGKGIYFADDPLKSLAYDGCKTLFIFLVILGDCLSVEWNSTHTTLVREPEKKRNEQRNLHDICFDSIVSRIGQFNEYVVFNRYQCCPLYKIRYQQTPTNEIYSGIYATPRNALPPFIWQQTGSVSKPPPAFHTNWPYFAENLFAEMGFPPVCEEETVHIAAESAESISDKMTTLSELGFSDADTNMKVLIENSYDIDRTINSLLELNALSHDDEPSGEPNALEVCNKMQTLLNFGFTDVKASMEALKRNSYDIERSINHLLELNAPKHDDEPPALEVCNKMQILLNFGFKDVKANMEALKKNSYDIERSVNHLLTKGAINDQPTEDEILLNNQLAILSSLGFTDVDSNKKILEQYSCGLDATVNHLLNAMVGTVPEYQIKKVATAYMNDYRGQVDGPFMDVDDE